MTDREKEFKAFSQCADALGGFDKKAIVKVFQLLSIHFEIVPLLGATFSSSDSQNSSNANQTTHLLNSPSFDNTEEIIESSNKNKQTNKSKPSANGGKKATTKSSNDLTYLTDFDFRPTDNLSLKEFFAKYKPSSKMECNLIFIYYLQELRKIEGIEDDHIYSCYRHLNQKIPSFPSTLRDTQARQGWIIANIHDLKLTREGINHLEHEMAKADD